MKLYRKKVDDLRIKEMKRLKAELPEESYQELKGSMWILRKREQELEEDEKETLNLLFSYSPDLKLAYQYGDCSGYV